MSHEITQEDGAAYSLAPAWHGLGEVFDHVMTVKEAFDASGLSAWEVVQQSLHLSDGTLVPSHVCNVRSDNGHQFGVVGKGYEPLQNADVAKFMDDFLQNSDQAGAGIESAGSLKGGSRIWALARLKGEDIVVEQNPDDRIHRYLLLASGHDGSSSVHLRSTPVRVVCANTLSLALSGKSGRIVLKLKHTKNLHAKLDEAKEVLGIIEEEFEVLERAASYLAGKGVTEAIYDQYLNSLFPDNPDAKRHTRTENIREAVRDCYTRENERTPETAESWWAAYNSVAQYVDHEQTRKETKGASAEENRFSATVMGGSGTQRKEQALQRALLGASGDPISGKVDRSVYQYVLQR